LWPELVKKRAEVGLKRDGGPPSAGRTHLHLVDELVVVNDRPAEKPCAGDHENQKPFIIECDLADIGICASGGDAATFMTAPESPIRTSIGARPDK
jgi:hypothetical protein